MINDGGTRRIQGTLHSPFGMLLPALLLMSAGLLAAEGEKRPNILFIMADDHAAHAISSYGSTIN